MREHAVERPWHAGEIERADEHRRVLDLAPAAGAHEAPKLCLDAPGALRGLLLERPEASELPLGFDDPLDAGRSEAADQLVLEVGVADVEAGPPELGAEAGPLDGEPEVALVAGVAQAGEPDALGDEQVKETPDVPGPPNRDDGDALSREVAAAPSGERLDGELIAHALDEDDGARGNRIGSAEGARSHGPESLP